MRVCVQPGKFPVYEIWYTSLSFVLTCSFVSVKDSWCELVFLYFLSRDKNCSGKCEGENAVLENGQKSHSMVFSFGVAEVIFKTSCVVKEFV